ncbi:LysM peptidoglycan-binding domain-containing protein [Saccharothrix sp. HUAS TT1]|uniref:LysM peptidoglycan-binding domain-containing protein n=1 Tax=unclassified Saccharothrix TaxID=2593673 RepID=UPI00345BA413
MVDLYYGIDISSHNDIDDWAAVRGNNITYASVKTTQGDYYINPKHQGQIDGARNAGVLPGAYHFADPNTPVARNIDHFVNISRSRGVFDTGSFMPMLDVEDSAPDGIHWNAWTANTFIPQFIRGLRDRTGQGLVSVYASLNDWRVLLRPDEWADDQVRLWVAVFNGDPGNLQGHQDGRVALHQHTAHGNVPGARGYIDRNVTVNDYSLEQLTIGSVTAPPQPGPAPQPVPTPGGWVPYSVKAGENLSVLAARFGTSVDELVRVNAIRDRNLIYPTQVLMVPGGTGGGDGSFPHRINPGETLSELAARFGTSVDAIVALNGIPDRDYVRTGDWISIPGSGGGGAPAGREYQVKPGQYLGGIAQELGVTVDHLVRLNNIQNPDLIHPGDQLRY